MEKCTVCLRISTLCPSHPKAPKSKMSTTVLEQIRAGHEDIESYERAVVSILHEKPRNVRTF